MDEDKKIIAIDPDVDKSGIAVVNATKKIVEKAGKIEIAELCEFFRLNADKRIKVIVEAGWLNVSNWHLQASCKYVRNPMARAAKIGYSTGENHRVGKIIIEIARYFGIEVEEMKPLIKCWSGHDKKITAEEIKAITGYSERTNQDVRDAILLAWVGANLPIRIISAKK